MARKITRTTTPNKFEAEEKLRDEIKQLEKAVKKMSLRQQSTSPELAELTEKLGRLHKNKPLFRSNRGSDRISRADATLRGSWVQDPFGASAPVDTDWSDEERDTSSVESDGCRGGWRYGVLSESPERPGPRFHTPIFVSNRDLFAKFGRRLANVRKKQHPTLAQFQESKAAVDCRILRDYFIDHESYEEIFEKYGRSAGGVTYGVYDVRVQDANSVADAIEFAAQKNGTFSVFDEGDECYTFFDQMKRRWRKVTARKINDKLFRVDFREENGDKYFLPEKLDPLKKESTIAMQRYIADLVDQGYALLKIAKPTEAEREFARQAREAEEQRVIARAQLGSGTNAVQYEHTATLPDQAYKPSQARALQGEYGRLIGWENKLRAEAEARATAGLNSFQLWQREQHRGEAAFKELMATTKAAEVVAKAARPWQAPVEPEPSVTPTPVPAQAPAVRPEVLLMSIQLLLAAAAAQCRPQLQGARL